VEAISVLEFEDFKVYNRWGQVVYDGKNNNYQGWDGIHNGRLAPSDVYVYRVKARFRNDDKPVDAKGEVTLIR
jgi:gliding motility-associated-like protein